MKSVEQLLQEFGTNAETGLSQAQIKANQSKFGSNKRKIDTGISIFTLILDQFKDITVVGLLISVIIGFALAMLESDPKKKIIPFINPVIVLLLLATNAVVSIYFELQAKRRKRIANSFQPQTANVLRDRKIIQIPVDSLVCGDIVELKEGDRAPADLVILEVESSSIKYEIIDESSVLSLSNSPTGTITAGASVIHGKARCLVHRVATNQDFKSISVHATPSGQLLSSQLDKFSHTSSVIILIVCIAVGVLNLRQKTELGHGNGYKGLLTVVNISLALAIASLPEHLSLHFKTAQSKASNQMSECGAVVMDEAAVDNVGRLTVLCGNLTSTFTSRTFVVKQFTTISNESVSIFHVSGDNFDPFGQVTAAGQPVEFESHKSFEPISVGSLLSNTPLISYQDGSFVPVTENLIDASLQVFATKLNPSMKIDPKAGDLEVSMLSIWSKAKKANQGSVKSEFTPEQKFASHQIGDKLFYHGNYDTILRMSKYYLDDATGEVKPFNVSIISKLKYQFNVWAKDYRPIAIAYEENGDIIWISGIAIHNTLHPDAMSTVDSLGNLGIRVILTTGENPLTAGSFGEKLRIETESVITRDSWLSLTDVQKKETVKKNSIFANFTSEEKAELIQFLREDGENVGMISGDVHDTLAMRAADISIASYNSCDGVKGAASIVCSTESTDNISNCVELSRATAETSATCVRYIISTGIAQLLISLTTSAFNLPNLLSASSILLLNLLTYSFVILISTNSAKVTHRVPKNLITKFLRFRYLSVGLVSGACVLGSALSYYLYENNISLHTLMNHMTASRSLKSVFEDRAPQTMAVVTLYLVNVVNTYDSLSQYSSSYTLLFVFASISGFGCLSALMYIPFTQKICDFRDLSPLRWGLSAIAILPLILVNIVFKIVGRKQ